MNEEQRRRRLQEGERRMEEARRERRERAQRENSELRAGVLKRHVETAQLQQVYSDVNLAAALALGPKLRALKEGEG